MGAGSQHRAPLPKPTPTVDHKEGIDMNDIDFNKAGMLLTIMEKVANVGPMMMAISGEAGEELKAINQACIENARERAEKIRQEESFAEQQKLKAVQEHDAGNAQPRGPIQPAEGQPYVPGQPVPGPVGEPSPTDKNRDGREDSMPTEPADRSGTGIGPYDNQSNPHHVPEPGPEVERRL